MLKILKVLMLSCMVNPLTASNFYVGAIAGYNLTKIHNTMTILPAGGRISFEDQHHALNGQKYNAFIGFRKEFNDYFLSVELLKGIKDNHKDISYMQGKRTDTFSYKETCSLHVKIGKEIKVSEKPIAFDFYIIGGVKNTFFHLKNVIPNNNPINLHTNKFSFVYGLGIEKEVQDKVKLRLEYISSFASPHTFNQKGADLGLYIHKIKFSPIHSIMFGISYHFN